MFFLLIAITLVAGLIVAYLLNKWFRADMEKCRADVTAGAAGPSGGTASAGPPVPRMNAKLYGAVAIFAVVVLFVGGAGLYQLNQELKRRDDRIKAQDERLKVLEYETWTARVMLELEGGGKLDRDAVRVTVQPPDIGFASPRDGDATLLVIRELPAHKPGRNLPDLYITYPGRNPEMIELSQNPDAVYDEPNRTVRVSAKLTGDEGIGKNDYPDAGDVKLIADEGDE